MSSLAIQSEEKIFYWCNVVATFLSFLGSLWMTILCLKTPSPKSVALKLILAIALSDLVYTVPNIISMYGDRNTFVCKVEGFLRELTAMLTIFFSTSMAILCYKDSSFNAKFVQEAFYKKAVRNSLLIAFILAVIPLFNFQVKYERQALFCWVGSTLNSPTVFDKIGILAVFEGIPLFAGLLISLVGYVIAIRNISGFAQMYLAGVGIQIYKLLWYPLVLAIIFIPSLIDNVLGFFVKDIPIQLRVLHLILTHSIGFANALVYGLQRPKPTPKLEDCGISMAEAHHSRDDSGMDYEEHDGRRTNSITEDLIRAGTLSSAPNDLLG